MIPNYFSLIQHCAMKSSKGKAKLNQKILNGQLSYLVYWMGSWFVLGIALKQKNKFFKSIISKLLSNNSNRRGGYLLLIFSKLCGSEKYKVTKEGGVLFAPSSR